MLALSEMYDLPKLKHLAESQILEAVNPETALHYLVVGSAHRSEWIKAKAVHFVVNDMARIMNTEEWAEVKRANPVRLSDSRFSTSSPTRTKWCLEEGPDLD